MMKMTQRADMICGMAASLQERVSTYEAAAEQTTYKPMAGYGVERADSREAIRRTVMAMRDELLRLVKQL